MGIYIYIWEYIYIYVNICLFIAHVCSCLHVSSICHFILGDIQRTHNTYTVHIYIYISIYMIKHQHVLTGAYQAPLRVGKYKTPVNF